MMPFGCEPRGFSVISLLLASALIAGGVFLFLQSMNDVEKGVKKLESTVLAEGYAVELLEFFRAQSSSQLKTYISANPFKPPANPTGTCTGCTDCTQLACSSCAQCTAYFLCSHTNLLDRQSASGTIINEDPIAALPPSLLDGPAPVTKANRFYQVQVVDAASLVPDGSACSQNAAAVTLTANQRYLVTVGVSWVPVNKTVTEAERVVLTAVIP